MRSGGGASAGEGLGFGFALGAGGRVGAAFGLGAGFAACVYLGMVFGISVLTKSNKGPEWTPCCVLMDDVVSIASLD